MRDQASESLKNKTCNMMIRILTLTGCILVCLATFHKASAQTRQSVTPGISAASVHGIQTTVPGTTAAGTGFPYTGLQEPYPGFRPGFDNDIKQMRNNIAPGLRYHLDNYTQYLPAAVMVGLKTFGYKGRSSWGRMLVSDAFSGTIMAGLVNGLKYTVRRPRPDGTARNSFPSGHTATAFMTAAMLHKEYGWRSPWFSIGGYAVAAFTGVSRVLNDRHYLTDVMAGATIGISSVHLGYFLADLIFKDRYLNAGYLPPVPGFAYGKKYYDIGLYFGYRFLAGTPDDGTLCRGGAVTGLGISVPIACSDCLKGTVGIAADIGINSYTDGRSLSFNTYDFLAGGYWRHHFAKILEADTRLLAGWSLPGNKSVSSPAGIKGGLTAAAGGGLGIATGENFKVKAFALYQVSGFSARNPVLHSILLGASASFFW